MVSPPIRPRGLRGTASALDAKSADSGLLAKFKIRVAGKETETGSEAESKTAQGTNALEGARNRSSLSSRLQLGVMRLQEPAHVRESWDLPESGTAFAEIK